MDLELAGKVAMVTGASRGIGAAIAAVLAAEGMQVCLVARDATALAAVAETLDQAAHTVVADLTRPEAPAEAVAAAVARFGRLDLLVNNAGATKRAAFFDLVDQDYLDGFALKFHGALRASRAAWPHLRDSAGSIVNIVGIGAHAGSAEFTVGGPVNAALLNVTKALADIGRREGVRVNAINPGRIETDRLHRHLHATSTARGITPAAAASDLLATLGLARFGRPQEVGWLVAYLASARAAFMQGSLIDIDGGETRSL